VIDGVPPKLELPPTDVTVNVTEVVLVRIPDLLTVQVVGEHVPEPVAPLLQVPETLVATGEPLFVTAIVTFAVHRDPLRTLELLRDTIFAGGADAVTLFVLDAWAPSLSVTVSVTAYVPSVPYVCEEVTPLPVNVSPKLQAYDAMVPSSDDADPSNEHVSPLQEDVNDGIGGWFGGGPESPTIFGVKTAAWTSRSGSLTPSGDSSAQPELPLLTSVEYSPDTPA